MGRIHRRLHDPAFGFEHGSRFHPGYVRKDAVEPGKNLILYKEKQKTIAIERIEILFQQAREIFNKDKDLSNRYVHLARTIAMKYKLRIPKQLKRQFCKYCYSYLMPGKNLRVRARKGKIVYYCLDCKKFMRFPH